MQEQPLTITQQWIKTTKNVVISILVISIIQLVITISLSHRTHTTPEQLVLMNEVVSLRNLVSIQDMLIQDARVRFEMLGIDW